MRQPTQMNRIIGVMAVGLTGAAGLIQADPSGGLKVFTIASTVPPNGDVNPYGVAIVPKTTGKLVKGHVLVSNFNNSSNLQGTGTTIVDIAANGAVNVFAQI